MVVNEFDSGTTCGTPPPFQLPTTAVATRRFIASILYGKRWHPHSIRCGAGVATHVVVNQRRCAQKRKVKRCTSPISLARRHPSFHHLL